MVGNTTLFRKYGLCFRRETPVYGPIIRASCYSRFIENGGLNDKNCNIPSPTRNIFLCIIDFGTPFAIQ